MKNFACLYVLCLCACASAKPDRKPVSYTPENLQFGPFVETIYDGCGNYTEIHTRRLLPGSREWIHEIKYRNGTRESRVFPIFRTGAAK